MRFNEFKESLQRFTATVLLVHKPSSVVHHGEDIDLGRFTSS
jgi:hypothetical protein